MPKRRRITLALVGAAAAAAVTVPILAQAGPGTPGVLLPDLAINPDSAPRNPIFNVYSAPSDNARLLLRFDGFVHNIGDGPLELFGNPQPGAPAGSRVDQYLSTQPPTNRPARLSSPATSPSNWVRVTDHPKEPEIVFDDSDTHNHFHLQKAAEYSLWNEAKTAQVVPGQKVGFCLYDSTGDSTNNGPLTGAIYTDSVVTGFCQANNPGATNLREGVSEGWMDEYDATLDMQWIDVSNVPPGDYYLAGRMDPDNHIKEKDENNGYGFSAAPVRVPGYRAQAVATTTGFRTAKTFSLASQSFAPTVPVGPRPGDPPGVGGIPAGYAGLGTLRYRIESLPTRGVLRNGSTVLAAGATLPAGVTQLSYTPNTTFSGVDTFAFSAVNYVGSSPSRYPLQPAQATATVSVGGSGIAVGVSGVPGQMVVGTQAQLSVTTTGTGATWTVDGVPGGNATVGTVTPGGLYTAPAAIPPGGKVTIQAVSTDDEGARSAPVEVAIVTATAAEPKPIVDGTIRKPGVLAVGRNVTVSMQLPRSGRLTVGLYRGSARLGGCVINVPGAQTASCKIRMRKPYDPGTLRIRTAFADGSTVVRGNVSAGGNSFTRLSVTRRGARVVIAVVPKRPGLVRVAITRRGKVVAQCSSRVLAGRALTCSRPAPRGTLGVSVTLKDNQGRLVVRELTRR